MREKFKKGEIVSATRTFNGEIITGEFLGYRLFNDENPDTVVGIVDVPGDGVYDVDVTSLRHYVKSTRYSDDEKIRNEIIDFFRGAANGQTKVISGANSLMWADWLEKQKEQKPTECSEEDEEMRNLIIAIFEANHPDGFFKANELGTTDMRGVHTEEIISWLKSLRPQPKQEWSKEDEVVLNAAIKMVENSNTIFCFEVNKYKVSNWLKSLRPQPKQEWGEEDKKILNAIISVLKEINSQPLKRLEDWDGYIRFLESIRPQWKPSEGQMKNFPKWKKADRDWDAGTIDFAVFHKNDGGDHEDWFSVEVTNRLYKGEYYIELSDLDKLPKEE